MAKTSDSNGYDFQILRSVMDVNRKQKLRMAQKMSDFYQGNLKGKVVALWGLAFKPNTDDIREAPALETIQQLLDAGAEVRAFDPEAMDNVRAVIGDKITFTDSKYEATNGADCLAIMTEWNEFRNPDFGELKNQLNDNVIFDGRNLYDLDIVKDAGLAYLSIGRLPVNVALANNKVSI